MRRFVFAYFALILYCAAADVQNIPVDQFMVDGNVDGNKVKDPDAPVSLQLAAGWKLVNAVRWGTHETTLSFLDEKTHRIVSLYYQFPIQTLYPAEPEKFLIQGMNAKVIQRQKEEGFTDYRIRTDSVKAQTVDEHPALSYVADFTRPPGQKMVEYMLRVLAKTMKAHFFLMLPAGAQTDDLLARLDVVVQTLNIP